jgi:hypothetical protein
VHDLAHTLAPVQVAEYSNPHEDQVAATTRALHLWRERVKPHGKLWHLSLLRRLLLAACWAALPTEVARKVDREVDDKGPLAARLAGTRREPRLKTGWLALAHHFPFGFFAFLLRTAPEAAAAFLARAVRCSGVMVSRLRLPPIGDALALTFAQPVAPPEVEEKDEEEEFGRHTGSSSSGWMR